MEDITVSLYVLLGAALLAAVVFLLTRRAARRRDEALAAYCDGKGFRLTLINEPTAREIQIEGDGWQLISGMRALQNTAQTGSSDWRRESEWVCTKENPARQTFALQISQGATDLDRLPDWVRDAALAAMRLWLGEDMQLLASLRTAFCEGGRTGVVFEPNPHAADPALEQIRLPLAAWHGGLPLYIECSPARIRIYLPDTAVKSVPEVEALSRIAFALR